MSDTRTTNDDLTDRLTHPRWSRSSRYDARWTVENQMGPHALWLLEWLAPALGLEDLRRGARVLDLGCGRAMTSVFLAREYDVQVTAADGSRFLGVPTLPRGGAVCGPAARPWRSRRRDWLEGRLARLAAVERGVRRGELQ